MALNVVAYNMKRVMAIAGVSGLSKTPCRPTTSWLLSAEADPPDELCCSACGSLAFRYPRALNDDKPVLCAGCGAFISTYGEIKRRLDEQE